MTTVSSLSPAASAVDLGDALKAAMQAHGQGQLDAAQALYQQVLQLQPAQADALHLLGVLQAQRGDHARAAELIHQAIAANPGEAMFHNNLGNVCVETGRFDEAQASYLRALELDGARLDALNNLGVLWSRSGRPDEAEQALLRVVELAPDFQDARQNLANLYLRAGRVGEAVQQCCDGLIVAPRNAALRRLLGTGYTLQGRNDQAAEVYRSWLAAEPGHPQALFHLAACTGQDVPERAPDAYVQGVFDSFAQSFDAKLASLSYRAPELMLQALARQSDAPAKQWRVLDAGCGTGLCAPLLAPYAAWLAGVDLSSGMLKKAQQRQAYDELIQADLVACLATRVADFDVIVSADTLCYFGALEAFAAAAQVALRPGGLLCFTVEASDEGGVAAGFCLQANGRFSHRRSYVQAVLIAAGLVPAETVPEVLRMEGGEPVQGWLISARAPMLVEPR
ncbi:MAG: tetratricopeptide repeat protein [Rubrivivax sp.]|nr:tetratricopeptide repeat protein [Rubrivivax sp.]